MGTKRKPHPARMGLLAKYLSIVQPHLLWTNPLGGACT
jgi:hypothetical protein